MEAQHKLFRKPAIVSATSQLFGDVMIVPKLSISVLCFLLMIWVAAIIVWLSASEYSRHVSVQGWIEPNSGIANQFASKPGQRVEKIYVEEEQYVSKGQNLIKLSNGMHAISGEQSHSILIANTDRQIEEIESQKVLLQEHYKIQRDDIHSQMDFVQREVQSLDDIIGNLKTQVQALKAKHNDITKLQLGGWVNNEQVERSRLAILSAQKEFLQNGLTRTKIKRELNGLKHKLTSLPVEYKTEVSRLHKQSLQFKQKRNQLLSEQSSMIVASSSGYVTSILVKEGMHVDTKRPLLRIMPNDQNLVATIAIPSRAAGFVETGQRIGLRFDAFPHEKYGIREADIHSVSSAPYTPNQITQSAAKILEPVYLAKANLDSSQFMAFGKHYGIKAGMTFVADISLGSRTLAEWLLSPLYALKGRL